MIKSNRLIIRVICAICVLSVFSFNTCKSEQSNSIKEKNNTSYKNRKKGEYLVKLKPSSVIEDLNKSFGAYTIEKIEPVSRMLYKVILTNDPGIDKIIEIINQSGKFEYAEPNFIYRIKPPDEYNKMKIKK
jgi:hypothetical protein